MEREKLEVDVLFVGAGPASLSGALQLSQLVKRHNAAVEAGEREGPPLEPLILVLEKGREIGSHALSGAVIDPRGFDELLQGMDSLTPPYQSEVKQEEIYYLTEKRSHRFPIVPPPLVNHGCHIASLGTLVRWMSELCEQNGIEVYPGFPGAHLLLENGRVVGVQTADSGRDREGTPKSNFEPGMDVLAKITILGEGPCGTLSGQATRQLKLTSQSQPQIYAVGVKELWQTNGTVPSGTVYHTLGFPLDRNGYGGGFIYGMEDRKIALGFVVGLDHPNPSLDSHRLLQEFKSHSLVKPLLKGAKLVSYGAKTIPEGGLFSMPKLTADGLMIIGDSAGFLNAQRLKGIHLAVKSGMLAAETAFEALLRGDYSEKQLSSYSVRFQNSWAFEELNRVRNFRQSFQSGFWKGMLHSSIQFISAGKGIRDPFPIKPGHEVMEKQSNSIQQDPIVPDGTLVLDKLSDLYHSDTSHEEDQPCHLIIEDSTVCDKKCGEEYGYPCTFFCPANVYEITADGKTDKLQINFSNCIHCKTCEIADPYQIIRWTVPEGGGGPNWKEM